MAQLLIEKGADLEAEDTMHRTPLFYALLSQNIELVRFCLLSGSRVDFAPELREITSNLSPELLNLIQTVQSINEKDLEDE
jgi:ankyrin repeat protein